MKKVLKVVAVLAGIIGIGIAFVFYLTAGIVQTGEDFFAAAKEGDTQRAYSLLAAEFQAGTTPQELEDFLNKLLVREIDTIDWGERSISGGQGSLGLSLKLAGGGVVPLSIDMIKEGDVWKIYTIRKSVSGIQETPQGREIPGGADLVRLVNASTMVFATAVYEKSMARLYDHISVLWQQQTSVEALDQVFGSFYGLPIDLRVLEKVPPVFDGTTHIDDRGVLVIEGHYLLNAQRLTFKQSYVFEGTGWKLIGLSVNLN